MSVWVYEYECMSVWVWVYEYMSVWVYKCTSVWVYECKCMSVVWQAELGDPWKWTFALCTPFT